MTAAAGSALPVSALPVLRVGGVPEHFNLSWHIGMERKLFEAAGVRVEWVEIKEGTGAMIQSLKEGKVDLIVALTEGLISDIAKNLHKLDAATAAASAPPAATGAAAGADTKADAKSTPAAAATAIAATTATPIASASVPAAGSGRVSESKVSVIRPTESELCLLSTYVESPLTWAISTGAKSAYHSVEDLKGSTISISRPTSGSHLMTCVLASQRGWNPAKDITFLTAGDFKSLRASVNAGTSAAFMWETFTTKPYHDSGEIRRIGEITTPWPCFLIASTRKCVNQNLEAVKHMFAALRKACEIFNSEPDMAQQIAKRYGLKDEDAAAWYRAVRIHASDIISAAAIDRTVSALRDSGVLPASLEVDPTRLIDDRFLKLLIDIKAMKLYNKPELITALWNNLRAVNKAKGDISYVDVLPFDQNHYYGTAALDECATELGFIKSSAAGVPATGSGSRHVINIGSSVGGCARYLSGAYGVDVLAIELQQDLHAVATEITARCTEQNMRDRITLMGGDFLQLSRHLAPSRYDAIVSWLTVLHFDAARRHTLLTQSFNLLSPGGAFYADDFFMISPLTDDERRVLRNDVYCEYLPSIQQYMDDIRKAGFVSIRTESLTAKWSKATDERYTAFASDAAVQKERHGDDLYYRLLFFYKQIAGLFAGGRVGGVRIIAYKPSTSNAAAATAATATATANAAADSKAAPNGSTALKRQATY